MVPVPDLAFVEKGNTHRGVNQAVLRFLWNWNQQRPIISLLDAPCGEGEFLKAVKTLFPKAAIYGQDLYAEPCIEVAPFFCKTDLRIGFENLGTQKFDVITNISGVMMFDAVSACVERSRQLLNTGGLLIVTNDNVLSVRDRLSFLFFGRVRRFKLLYERDEGVWNQLSIQALWKILGDNGLKVIRVQYTTTFMEDYAFLPLAILLYPIWWLSFAFKKASMSTAMRKKLFPFKCMLARHYILYAQAD